MLKGERGESKMNPEQPEEGAEEKEGKKEKTQEEIKREVNLLHQQYNFQISFESFLAKIIKIFQRKHLKIKFSEYYY